MTFARAFAKSVFAIATLAIFAPSASGQTTQNPAPAPQHFQLEPKPPDEPSSSSSPEEAAPAEAPSANDTLPPSGAQGEINTPISADAVAHPPEIVTYVVPIYPPEARAKKIHGRVLLRVVVDASGKVEDDIQVVDSIPMLDQAAIDAVRQYSFTPARDDDGNPVRVQLQVGVPFSLR